MKTSRAGRAFLGREEGCVLSAYRDSAGVWTIGFGHTAAAGPPVPKPGLAISLAEAAAIFARDLDAYERAVETLVRVPLAQHEFDALVAFAFNVGPDIDADRKAEGLGDSTLLRRLNLGDRRGAADEFAKWTKAGGRRSRGLAARRERERRLFLEGDYGGAGRVPVWRRDPGRTKPVLRAMPDTGGGSAEPQKAPPEGLAAFLAGMFARIAALLGPLAGAIAGRIRPIFRTGGD